MENTVEIFKVNWKCNLRFHAFASLIFCVLMPFFFDVKDMNEYEMAKITESYLILLGMICMVPVFLPDQDLSVRNVVDAKRTPVSVVCAIRLTQSLLLLSILTGISLLYFRNEGCSFSIWRYFGGTMAGMIFLGGIGMSVLSLTNRMPLSYMAPLLYYAINMGGGRKYLGNWYLNSMSAGSFTEKWYLLFTGILLIGLSFFFRTHVGKGSSFVWIKKIQIKA